MSESLFLIFSRNTSLSSFLLVLSPVFLPHLQNLTFISGLTLLSSFSPSWKTAEQVPFSSASSQSSLQIKSESCSNVVFHICAIQKLSLPTDHNLSCTIFPCLFLLVLHQQPLCPPAFFTIWCFKTYKPYICWKVTLLVISYHTYILIWWSSYYHISTLSSFWSPFRERVFVSPVIFTESQTSQGNQVRPILEDLRLYYTAVAHTVAQCAVNRKLQYPESRNLWLRKIAWHCTTE